MKTLEFNCPHCGMNEVEEVMGAVTVASKITAINEDGELDYGEQTNTDGFVMHYQCASCGHMLIHEQEGTVRDGEALVQFIEDQEETQRRDEKRGLYPDKADIAN